LRAKKVIDSGPRVEDTLTLGASRAYLLNGAYYNVSVLQVFNPDVGHLNAVLLVNGERTPTLTDFQTTFLSNGARVDISNILVNSQSGVVQFVLTVGQTGTSIGEIWDRLDDSVRMYPLSDPSYQLALEQVTAGEFAAIFSLQQGSDIEYSLPLVAGQSHTFKNGVKIAVKETHYVPGGVNKAYFILTDSGVHKATSWKCYDAFGFSAVAPIAISPQSWQLHADQSCAGHCYAGKCGVNGLMFG
jgi:hypothetical protein